MKPKNAPTNARPAARRAAASTKSVASLAALILTGSIASLVTAPDAAAATYYWDTTTTGIWGTGTNWSDTATTGGLTGVVPTATDIAWFNQSSVNGATIIQLDADQSVGGMVFANTGATSIYSDSTTVRSLTLGSSGIIISAGAGAVTLGNSTNVMNLSLGAAQTWTNNSSNTLSVVGGVSLANAGAQTLNLAGTGSFAFSGVLADGSGTLGLTQRSSGIVTLNGANLYTGTTTISGGTLQIGNGTTGSLNGTTGTALTFAGTGTFNVREAASSTQGMGTLTLSAGDATITSTGITSQTSTLTFGSLAARSAGATGNFVLATNTTASQNKIVLTSTTNAPLNNSGSNNPGLFFGGTDYTRYDTTNGYFRAVTYGTDTNAVAAIGTTAATLGVNDATKDLKTTANITAQTTASVNTLNMGATTLTLSDTAQVFSVNGILATGGSIATAGKIQPTSAGGEIVINVNSGTLSVSPVIQNNTSASSLTKSGAGTLSLVSSPTYTGVTTVNAGTLKIGSTAAANTGGVILGSSAITLQQGATLFFTASAQQSIASGGLIANSNITLAGGAGTVNILFDRLNDTKFVLGGTVTGASGVNQTLAITQGSGAGGAPAGGDRADILFSNTIADGSSGGVLGVNVDFAGASGTAQSAFVNLRGANTFTGAINVTNSRGLTSGAYLTIGGERTATGSLTTGSGYLGGGNYAGTISLATGIILNYASSAAQTLGGVISGAGALQKDGIGNLTLSGANTFAGTTTVNAGTLTLSNNLALQNSALTFGAGTVVFSGVTTPTIGGLSGSTNLASIAGYTGNVTVLTLNPQSGVSVTYSGIIADGSGAMTLTKSGAGIQTLSGPNTYTGATTLSSGTLSVGASNNLGGAASNLVFNGGTLQITGTTLTSFSGIGHAVSFTSGQTVGLDINNAANTFTADQVLSQGAGGLTKSGAGTLVLNQTNTYSGVTTVTAGTLVATTALALPGYNVPAGVVFNGGTVSAQVGGAGWTTAQVDTLLSNATKTSGALGIDTTNGSLSQWAAFTTTNLGATLGLIKFGSNTFTLNNSGNNYTGGTTVIAGTLQMSGTATLGSTSGTLTVNGGTLDLNGTSQSVGALNGTGGTIVLNGAVDTTLTVGTGNTSGTGFAGVISDGTGPGRLMLTKAGSGSLTLSGANTYSGGTTINGGTVNINSSSALGTGKLTVAAGTPTLNFQPSLAISNDIAVNSNTTVKDIMTTQNTITFSGVLSGASNINITNNGNNGVIGQLAFTNAANTWTGNVVFVTGSSPGDDRFSFNSIGDGGNFTLQKGGHQNSVIYTGSSNIAFNTRTINVGAISGIFDGGGNTPVNAFTNSGAGTVTFNSNMTVGAVNAGGGTLFFNGTNTGNNTYAGTIGAGTGGAFGIGKADTGKWVLTGSNSYTGEVLIRNGTLSVNAISTIANNQPLGKNAVVQLGHNSDSGILEFTGSTNSTTDKTFRMGSTFATGTGNGTILNNGSGSLTFSAGTFNPTITGITATRTLTLGGAYTGTNEIQGTIQDNVASTGKVAVTVSGSTWALSGSNTYTGGTSVTGGTLLLKGAVNMPSTGTLAVGAGGNFSLADGTVRNTTAPAMTLTSGALLSFDWSSAGTADNFSTPSTAMTPASGATVGIIINPIGTPTGTNLNLLTGIAGSSLNNPNYFLANNTNFTATLTKPGAGAGSLTIGGYSTATALTNAYWKGGQVTNALGTMAFSIGTTSNWASDAAGTSAGGVVPGGSGVNVIFGATGAAQQASVTTGASMNLGSITFNDSTGVTLAGSHTITLNSTSTSAANTTAALATVTPGSAISVTSFANASNTISANIALGASQTWNVASGKNLTVSGSIFGPGFALTKSDAGTLTLAGANTYTGGTTISAGVLAVGQNNGGVGGDTISPDGTSSSLGSGAVIVAAGAALQVNTGGLTINNDITLNGLSYGVNSGGPAATNGGPWNGALMGASKTGAVTNTFTGTLTLNATSNVSTNWSDKTMVLGGKVTGVGGLVIDNSAPTVRQGGIIQLGNPNNNYSGDTTVNNGNTAGAQPTLILGASNVIPDGAGKGNLSVLGNLKLNGFDETVNGLSGSGLITNGHASNASTLTVGNNNATGFTFSGNIQNGSGGTLALTKTGTGTLTLSGAGNSYTGATTINGGTLQIGSGGRLGAGSYAGAISIGSGAFFQYNSIATQTLSGAITGAGSLTMSGAGTLTLSGSNTYTGGTNVNAGTLLWSGANNLPGTGVLAVNGGVFSLADGIARATTANGGLTIATGSGFAFDWVAGAADSLTTTANVTPAAGTMVGITINGSSTPTGGPFTLISAGAGSTLNNPVYYLANASNYTATLSSTATTLTVTGYTSATALTNIFWMGNTLVGASTAGADNALALTNGVVSNWSSTDTSYTATSLTPGATSNMIFSNGLVGRTQQTTVLGANMSVNSVTIDDGTAVTIAGSGNTLTLLSTSSAAGTAATPGSAISVTSNAANPTISTNLVLGANQTWNVASGKTLAVSGVVSGSSNLAIAGGGTVNLSGVNTYTGTTTISAGTLSVASLANAGFASNLGAYATAGAGGISLNGGTLQYTGSSGVSVDRGFTLAANSTIDINPASTALTLGASSLGAFTLNVTGGSGSSLGLGATALTGAATLNPTTASLTVASVSGTQNLTLGGTATGNAIPGVIATGTGTLTKSGTGSWTLSGLNTYTGTTSVNAGTLTLSGGNSAASMANITVGSTGNTGAVLNLTGGSYNIGTNTFFVGQSSNTGETGTVNQSGGTFTIVGTTNAALLVGNGSGTGTYNLSAGTLNISFTSNTRGAMLGVNTGSAGTFNLSGTGVLNLTGSATLMVGRNDTAISSTTTSYNQTGGTASVVNLAIGGTGAAANTTNSFSVTGGTFTATNFLALGASSGANNTSTLTIGGNAVVTLPNFPAKNAAHSVTLYLDGGTLKNSAGSGTFISGLTNAFIKAGGATFDTSLNSATISQNLLTDAVSTGGGLTKNGANTLTLSGTNTYTGATTVNAGTLVFTTNNNPVGSSAGTLRINAGATVYFNPSAQSNAGNSGNLAYTIGNPITLTNAGTANLQFNMNDTKWNLTGGVTGGAGLTQTLAITTGVGNSSDRENVLFSGAIADGSGGTLGLSVIFNTWAGNTNQQYVNLSGANTFTGPISVTNNVSTSSGYLTIGGEQWSSSHGGGTAGSGYIGGGNFTNTIALGTSTFLDYYTSANQTLGGVISGAGSLIAEGSGTLTLSGANTYTGTTTVNTGTLSINSIKNVSGGASALGTPATIANGTVAIGSAGNSATLVYTGTGDTTDRVINLAGTTGGATLDQSGTGLLKFTSALTATGAGSKTLTLQGSTAGTGEIAGAIVNNSGTNITSVAKVGTGVWTLSGANTYTGATSIANGTLSASSLNSVTGGVASSSLGAPTTVANGTIGIGSTTTTGVLVYTGTGETTDRVVNLAGTTGGATLDQSGTGLLKFTSSLTATGAGSKTLTLQGSTAGTGEIAGAIVDNSGTNITSVTKAGTGSWTLSGNNTYTGVTTVTGGTLKVAGSLSGTLAVNVTSGTLLLAATNAINNTSANLILGYKDAIPANSTGGNLALEATASNRTQTFGSLTLSYDSTLDFGSGPGVQELTFNGLGSLESGMTLSITNWTGNPYTQGTTGTNDRLIFNYAGDLSAFNSAIASINISFNGITGYQAIDLTGNRYEIVAIPEPSTWMSLGLMLGLAAYRERRRFMRRS